MDLFTVNKDGTRNGSVRIFKAANVVSGQVSRRVGSMLDNCTNVEKQWQLDLENRKIVEAPEGQEQPVANPNNNSSAPKAPQPDIASVGVTKTVDV